MPVDRNPRRQVSGEGDDAKQREQELRRARGEIACVECQRLKLRCNRKVPCDSCIRRHRAAMCPNGHAWSDEATRTLLSDTTQLHRKLSEMSQRIRQLEDGLEISHAANSTGSHPLLREELLAVKRGIGPISGSMADQEVDGQGDGQDADVVEAMGTMSISDRGVSRFIGRTGGGESLIFLGNDGDQPTGKTTTGGSFPQQLLSRGSEAWLLMPPNASRADVIAIIDANMPPFARASSLCETYLENFSWILRAVHRGQLFSELIPGYYKRTPAQPEQSSSSAGANGASLVENTTLGSLNAHELALVLAVFAVGALTDLTLPPYNDEGERYYEMALAALSLSQVLGTPSLAAVQAVSILALYNAHCGRNATLDVAGSFLSLAANLGISMGLHRDCARWQISPEIVNRRRFLFWELFTSDLWHNLANGKPPSFVLKYCDVKFPEETEKYFDKDGRPERSYWTHRHEFARDLIYPLCDLCGGVKSVKYSKIMEIDRRMSELAPPSHLRIPPGGSSMESDGPQLILQRVVSVMCYDGLMMYMHRGFFAKALLSHPDDPLKSPFAHSYLSAYRSALSMLKVIREHYALFPNLFCRFWSFWSHAFSAAIIIGSIVMRSSSSETAHAALVELNLAVGLFEKAAQHSDRARRSLPTLLRMREKAYKAAKSLNIPSAAATEKATTEGEDELLIFSGKGKLVSKDMPKVKSETPPPATFSMSPSPTLPLLRPAEPQNYAAVPMQLASSDSAANSTPDMTVPPTPDILAMSTSLPSAWSAWSDQEALLINYLTSGVDLNVAQNVAYAGEADITNFMWPDMSQGNSPEAQQGGEGTQDADRLQTQAGKMAPAGDFSSSSLAMFGIPLGAQESSAPLPGSNLQASPQAQAQYPMPMGNAPPWDPSQWDPQTRVFY